MANMVKPNLALFAEIRTADGNTYRWGDGSNDAGRIPKNIRFSTRLGDGFADGGCTLARRVDKDYSDVNLLDDFNLIGADGSVAYEGRIGANPRSVQDTHSMDIVAAGWMTHARDAKQQVIFVDRDFRNWQQASVGRRKNLISGNWTGEPQFEVTLDDSNSPAIATQITDAWSTTGVGDSEAWYDSRGLGISAVYYAWNKSSSVNSGDTNWHWLVNLSSDDKLTSSQATSELRAAGPGTGTLTLTAGTFKPFAMIQLFYQSGTAAGAAGTTFAIYWTTLAVFQLPTSAIVRQGTTVTNANNSPGYFVSDMVRYIITTFCPKLDPSGIESTYYTVQQAAYRDPTDPFDMIADLNKYHRFIYGVQENKQFYYRSVDLSDYDWAVDYADPGEGVTVNLQGDSTDGGLYNGICVNFTNLQTQKSQRLTPYTTAALRSSDTENVATRHGLDRFAEITLSFPAMPADAAQIGAAALLEMNTPKGQGSITVKGHIKDRAGHWQQGWKVRAGDRVAIISSSSLSDRPRLISETSWDHESGVLTITVEDTAQRIDAFFDRMATALQAANLA